LKEELIDMQSTEKGNLIFARLFSGEIIHEELEEVCKKHNVVTAVVISGIGQLKDFELGYFRERGDYSPEAFDEAHELLSLSGNIIEQDGKFLFHLHAVLGNRAKEAVGGHLIRGTVEVTNEIVLLKSELELRRRMEDETGLMGLRIGEDG